MFISTYTQVGHTFYKRWPSVWHPVEKTSSNIKLTLIHTWCQRRETWKNNHTKACGNTMTVHHGGNPDTNSSSVPAATNVNSHLTPTGTRTCSVRLVFKACSSYRKGPLGLHWGANWPSEGHSLSNTRGKKGRPDFRYSVFLGDSQGLRQHPISSQAPMLEANP